ncbi:MAG: VCBS repeat-containing protein [Cyclobacteriaceae bacterium]|nr:VCBS repeat-containing protein [Cyclobacteriaceae bacterium]
MRRVFLLFSFSIHLLTVLAQVPTITSFTPTSGPIGTSVTIIGTNFNATPANNIVFFGATKATVTEAITTQLTVTVPVGATYQPITVLTNGLLSYSSKPFMVTFNGVPGLDANSFAAKVDFTTGTSPYSVSIGDLDGDGKTDLAVPNNSSNTVSVFRNTGSTGSISYTDKMDFTASTGPVSVSIGDLDVDGKAELAVANVGPTVSVFHNTGNAGNINYAAKTDFTTGLNPVSVSIGDLDRDGKADMVVTSFAGNTFSVFRNTSSVGNISYATKMDFATGPNPFSSSVGDLDGDGKADLAVTNTTNNSVSVFRNTSSVGSISYATSVNYGTGGSPRSVSIGDLDGDGKSDLVVANFSSNSISVFRNTSSIGNISFVAQGDFITGVQPWSVSIGDLDGDGKADLAVANGGSNTVSIFRNTSSVGNISYTAKVDFTTGSVPVWVSIGDLDGDGKPDLVVANNNSNTVSVFRNTVALDTSPPVVAANNTLSTVALNSSISVSANFTDASGIATNPAPRVFYRPIAGVPPNNFVSVDMTLFSGSTYTATIPANAVTELGVEYKYLVTDRIGLDNSASQILYKTRINHSAGLPLSSYPGNAAGAAAVNYRIIAFPLVLENKTINDIFNNDLGGYDPKNWRMFKYNGSSFNELNASSVVSPGEGYWFITISSSPLNTGPGITVDASTDSPFVITLQPGWNQIGNPYNFNISWADIVAANPTQAANLGGNSSKIRVFRGSIDNVDVLNTLEGGFVKYLGTSAAAINIPVSKNISIQGRTGSVDPAINSLDKDDWEIFFTLKNGSTEYTLGGIGMHPEAKEDFDYHDDFTSPRFIDYLEVTFPKKYVGMTYTKDVVPTAENQVWDFKVESNLKGELTSINWDNSYFGNEKEIFLLDVTSHHAINMNKESHYNFNTTNSRDFKIIFGNPDYVKQELTPSKVILFEPYPNPFNNQVLIEFALPNEMTESNLEIEILNSMGSKISSIPISQTAGLNSWNWESNGQPAGLYFVRLKVGDQYLIKKLLKK